MLDRLEVFKLAVSLGGTESLASHPASMTHATYSAEERAEHGISDGLVRMSVGLENTDDILAIPVTPIVISGAGSPSGTHTLSRSLSGLVDGQTYYVVNPLGDGSFQLAATRGALKPTTNGSPCEPLGVGIGSPGPINLCSGVLGLLPNLPGWDNFPLRAALSQAVAMW